MFNLETVRMIYEGEKGAKKQTGGRTSGNKKREQGQKPRIINRGRK